MDKQAGFAPGCAYFLSSWYRRYELATRYAIMYTSVPLAGALSGLLAGVIIQHMDGLAGLAGWRWLFVSLNLTPSSNIKLIYILDYRGTCICRRRSRHLFPYARLSIQQLPIPRRRGNASRMQSTSYRRHWPSSGTRK